MARVLNSALLRRRRRSASGIIVVSDTFTRADSALLLGNAETGQAWSALAGTWGITGNRAYCPSATANGVAAVDSTKANASVSVVLAAQAGLQSFGLAFRISDASNYWLMAQVATDTLIQKVVAGVATTVIVAAGITPSNGDTFSVKLSGNSIIAYKNGVQLGSGSDAFNATATKHGLILVSGGAGAQWDNFVVQVP